MKFPFVTGFASQNYLLAEEGILSAFQNNANYWYIDASLSEEHPDKWSTVRINHLLSLVAQYQVFPIVHGNFKAPIASDVESLRKSSVEYVKKEIDFAHALNAPLIVHGSVIVEPRLVSKVKKMALDQFVLSVETLLEYAEKRGVTLYLENLSNYTNYSPFHYIFTTPAEVKYVIEKISEIKLFFDVGHANIGNDPIEFFKSCHQSIAGMSFSNNNGDKDQHCGLDKGEISYADLVEAILDCDWLGIIAFETRGKTTSQSIDNLGEIYKQVLQKKTGIHA